MIKSNKRKPGTINNLTRPTQPHTYDENNPHYISYDLNAETHILDDLNKQKTVKRYINRPQDILCDLDLANRNISNLEKQLDRDIKLECIKSIDLSQNNLTSFPSIIFNKLINLTNINLQNNALQKISFPYFEPNLIKTITVSNNHLSSLNLQHLSSLTQLQCQHNQLTFLTLPPNLTKLDCSNNKLSNIYCMEYCVLLEQIYINSNMLYDLKLNFAGRVKGSNAPTFGDNRFKYLKVLDCSNNKIQHVEGLSNILNVRTLQISQNKLAFTRNIINEILLLQQVEELYFEDNPITEAGFTEEQIYEVLCTKMEVLKIINSHQLTAQQNNDEMYSQATNSARKSQFGLNDEPYCLFMQSSSKKNPKDSTKEWIFTLGDCQPNDNQAKQNKINELSLIEQNQITDMNQTVIDRLGTKMQSKTLQSHQSNADQNGKIQKLLCNDQELKLKVVRSSPSITQIQHIHYQSFLNALLQMSYVPCQPVLSKASKITSKRLDEEHDDFLLISKMFQQRGGVVYVKKITAWVIEQEGNELFSRHHSECTAQMGFLLNEINEKSFKELCRYGKLIRRSEHDILGLQPNVFSCYHVIVRYGLQKMESEYAAAYLIESGHL